MNEWIDIKDRKPDKDGRYLVVEVYSNYPWVGVCSLREGKWDSPSIKYWMPLPEAPK
jgi:RimJ/RimL family protein N-acetyltransferase